MLISTTACLGSAFAPRLPHQDIRLPSAHSNSGLVHIAMDIHLGSGGPLPLTRSGLHGSHLRRHPGHHPRVRHAITRNRNTGRRADPSDRKSTTGHLCMPQRWLLPLNFAAPQTDQFRLRIYETNHTTGCRPDADTA